MSKWRLRETGEVLSLHEIKARFATSSFGPDFPNDVADPVLPSPKPATDRLTVAYRNGIVQDANGNWVENWQTKARDVSLDRFKQELNDEVTSLFYQYRDAGTTVTIGGQQVRIETTHSAQQEVSELVELLSRRGGNQKVATRSGSIFTADAATAEAMRDAVSDHVSVCWTNDAELRERIDEATTLEQANSIDLTTGWPG